MKIQKAKHNEQEIPCLIWMDRKSGPCLNIQTQENGPGLDLADAFKEECYLLPKTLQWFHQGGCIPGPRRSCWHMFEFWVGAEKEFRVLEAAMELAEQFGLEIELGVPTRKDFENLAEGRC